MIKTPTYYVFKMYAAHQGAELLSSELLEAGTVGKDKNELAKVYESVSENKDGVITITLTNNSLEAAEDIDVSLTKDGDSYNVCEASIVKGAMNAHNTFEAPEVVKEEKFEGVSKVHGGFKISIPACSVVSVRIKK